MEMLRKVFKDCEVKGHDDAALIIEHFISTETQDDGGDIMLADGMQIRGRPVVLFQHGLDPSKGSEPIAKPIDLRVGVNKDGKKGIVARTQYYDGRKLTPPDNTGQRLYEKNKLGFMPNWSIGFSIDEAEPVANGGRLVKKWSLHEYSQVAVGMNSEATTDEDKELVELCTKSIFKIDETPVFTLKEEIPVPKFTKSITDQLVGVQPMENMRMIYDAFLQELFNFTFDKANPKTPDEFCGELLTELSGLIKPWAVKFIEDVRASLEPANQETVQKEIESFKYQTHACKKDNAEETPPPAIPVPGTEEALPSDVPPPEPIGTPLAFSSELVAKLKEPDTVSVDIESLTKRISDAVNNGVKNHFRKLTGKLD